MVSRRERRTFSAGEAGEFGHLVVDHDPALPEPTCWYRRTLLLLSLVCVSSPRNCNTFRGQSVLR